MPFARLRPLVADRDLRRQLLAYLLARLPSGMLLLALLLFARSRLGDFGSAGTVLAAYSVAVAVVAPLLGRLADRAGSRPVLAGAAVAHLAGMLFALTRHDLLGISAGAVVAGAGLPPSPAVLRAAWRTLPDGIRQTVFSLDGVLLELVNVVGPLIVVGLVSAFHPATALITASGLLAAGAVGTILTVPRRRPAPAPDRRHWLGPIRVPAVVGGLVLIAVTTAALGFVEIGCVAYATHRHNPALAGVLFALMSAGSMAGGLLNAARPGPLPVLRKVQVLFAVAAIGFIALALAGAPWLLAVILLLANVTLAPLFACLFDLLAVVAPEGAATETFTWAASANFVAIGIGQAAAGHVVAAASTEVVFVVAGVVMASGVLLALVPALRRLPVAAGQGLSS